MLSLGDFTFCQLKSSATDVLAGTSSTCCVDMSKFHKGFFIIQRGQLATGEGVTPVFTVLCHAAATAAKAHGTDAGTAIPFTYQKNYRTAMGTPANLFWSSTNFKFGSPTRAASTGYTATAIGASDTYDCPVDIIEVDSRDIDTTKKWVNLKFVETVDSAIDGTISFLGINR
jgi:hypothetical protein